MGGQGGSIELSPFNRSLRDDVNYSAYADGLCINRLFTDCNLINECIFANRNTTGLNMHPGIISFALYFSADTVGLNTDMATHPNDDSSLAGPGEINRL